MACPRGSREAWAWHPLQFGTVVESSADFYSSRIPKRDRKSTIVDEILADDKSRAYYKRRFTEVQDRQMALTSRKRFKGKKPKGSKR